MQINPETAHILEEIGKCLKSDTVPEKVNPQISKLFADIGDMGLTLFCKMPYIKNPSNHFILESLPHTASLSPANNDYVTEEFQLPSPFKFESATHRLSRIFVTHTDERIRYTINPDEGEAVYDIYMPRTDVRRTGGLVLSIAKQPTTIV